jgi:hypothetical protein
VTARRWLSLAGVLLGTALLAVGVVVAVGGATAHDSPATVVRGYFAALARGDAAQALAYGTVPTGPRRLLTSTVLREQLRIAALRDVSVESTERRGDRATVTVRYAMTFAGGAVSTSTHVKLHRADGDWWLDRVAVAALLAPSTAQDRLAILGARVPSARILLFPGALPITTDTPYLELVPTLDYVSFDTPATVDVPVRVSAQGQAAVRATVRAALDRCLAGSPPDLTCPLPTDRYVPGTVRGKLNGSLGGLVDLDQNDPAGVLTYAGSPTITGSWQRLDFDNMPRREHAQVQLDVRARGYAVAPLTMRWTG